MVKQWGPVKDFQSFLSKNDSISSEKKRFNLFYVRLVKQSITNIIEYNKTKSELYSH